MWLCISCFISLFCWIGRHTTKFVLKLTRRWTAVVFQLGNYETTYPTRVICFGSSNETRDSQKLHQHHGFIPKNCVWWGFKSSFKIPFWALGVACHSDLTASLRRIVRASHCFRAGSSYAQQCASWAGLSSNAAARPSLGFKYGRIPCLFMSFW